MNRVQVRGGWALACALALGAGAAVAEVVPASGWLARTIATPAPVQGGIEVDAGGALLVGQGAFGPGMQQVVRVEGDRVTTIATGFGSLGGFALAPDGTLYVVDNCWVGDFACDQATTGDTVYAIPDARTRTDPIAAAAAEVLPPGSIASVFEVAHDPGLGLLVSDAAGPGAGRVLRLDGGRLAPLVRGLDYAGGVARRGDRLLVANSDASFVGSIRTFDLAGSPLGALVDGLSGAFAAASGPDAVYVTGGFTEDFLSSTVVAVGDDGSTSEIARGFAFSGDATWSSGRGALYVLDFEAPGATVLCPDANRDGACDATCGSRVPGRTLLAVRPSSAPEAGPRFRLRTRLAAGDPADVDPSRSGLLVRVVEQGGRVLLDALVPPQADWRRRGRRWRTRDDGGGPLRRAWVRAGRRATRVTARGRLSAVPTGPVQVIVSLPASGGPCGGAQTSCAVRQGGRRVRCR